MSAVVACNVEDLQRNDRRLSLGSGVSSRSSGSGRLAAFFGNQKTVSRQASSVIDAPLLQTQPEHNENHRGAAACSAVTVVARVRPVLSAAEARQPDGVRCSPETSSLSLESNRGDKKNFTLDQVFDGREPEGSQTAIFGPAPLQPFSCR
eukprot:TRINITY_DN70242_c0_g1_i1.p1 TRINITY_DN70242_c0_g1~~TRINITY_DN70242_c0_g1_i1.p1  ORF type:complete len:150 (-),score=21.58 TRINITY_DN70242_c0_g1_i1:51-500(-)